jgi:ABC-type antimicrobial peptide transport system permease subunit
MTKECNTDTVIRFGAFEANLRSGELRKQGVKLKLGDQPFSVLAILLAQPGEVVTGLYGTLAYRVNHRIVEIGVQMAVGARRGQVIWMVLRDSLILTAIGEAIGIPLAALVAKALTSALYGVRPYDILSYSLAVYGVVCVALVASLIPARRAANIDPLSALRAE